MSDVGTVVPALHRNRLRLTVSILATVFFALALVMDVLSGIFQPTCPPGWTSWSLEPGLAVVIGIPLVVLLVLSAGVALRALRAQPTPHHGLPIATVLTVILGLVSTVTLVVFVYGLVVQVTDPNTGCITF